MPIKAKSTLFTMSELRLHRTKMWQLHPDPFQPLIVILNPGGTQHICIRGGSVREIFWQPKNISSASLLPKNITYFYALTTVNENKNPEIMLIEARIASAEPRNISSTMFYAQKISSL